VAKEHTSRRNGWEEQGSGRRRRLQSDTLRAGMNPIRVQWLLGHTSLEMTRRYLSVIEDGLLAAHEQHGPVVSVPPLTFRVDFSPAAPGPPIPFQWARRDYCCLPEGVSPRRERFALRTDVESLVRRLDRLHTI